MYAKIRINGDILVKTGMHIGGSSAFAAIGAVDSPIVRDVRSNLPLLPGSSLKGKMRSLLEYDYIGGSGSRGYGKIAFENIIAETVVGEVSEELLAQCNKILSQAIQE